MKTVFLALACFLLINTTPAFPQSGSLDKDFGIGGKVTTDIGNSSNICYAAAIQTDGKILLAGYSYVDGGYDFVLIRYNAEGTLDNTFGVAGKVTTDIRNCQYNCSDRGRAVIIQSDGKILLAGQSLNGGNTDYDFAMVRYNPNGTLDNTFGIAGKVITAIGGDADYGRAVLIQADGKILVAGQSINDNSDFDFAIVRYKADGTLDSTFAVDGIVTTDFGGSGDLAQTMAMQPDGKILVAGSTWDSDGGRFALVRYNTDGTLDNSFGLDGKIATAIGHYDHDEGYAVAIQPDGKILVAGRSVGDNCVAFDFAVVRYNTDGTLDNTFGTGGKLTTTLGKRDDHARSVIIQADGKILVAGYSRKIHSVDDYDFAMVRYNVDGTVDKTFGKKGIVLTDFNNSGDHAQSILMHPNGNILVAGYAWKGPYSGYDFAMALYISNLNIGNIDFSLQINEVLIYPNPIQKDALLEYNLMNDEVLSLTLYDMSGRFIRSIFTQQVREKGAHQEAFKFADSIPSGNYILVLSNFSRSISIKILK